MSFTIFPSVNTLSWLKQNNWRDKVKEIDRLGLKNVAVFVTTILFEERQELYGLLEKTGLEAVPFVHIKSDMRPEEMEYFIRRWKTGVFNHHLLSEFPLENDLRKFYSKIYLENTLLPFSQKEFEGFAGICLDFSHLEDTRRSATSLFENWMTFLLKYPLGCGHISAVGKTKWFDKRSGFGRFSQHYFTKLSDFDYLQNYPKELFPEILAIELENSLEEQLKAKEYIEKILETPSSSC